MPPSTSRPRQLLLAYGYLTPFAVLAVYGLFGWCGWFTGHLGPVQPRSYDAALPANAGSCLILIAVEPIALALGWREASLALGLIASVWAWATLVQGPLN